ncbi:MAG TPA: DUF3597 domain-containing protein [Ramlibacter sp.]|jgi:3-oxoacyl-ACP reductase-like protein|uniref:DUF3597 domain-containing protein n=1 Tax=Ramlibacter sp. TaxID=1917967 RepID=UPI002D481C43|nr:DUF3597 domain-containing protein [Ramlibacter sp.]HZY16898.1 DUF3597 domain-containing protein [Ramlibacter sp.]
MSILGKIFGRIFPNANANTDTNTNAQAGQAPASSAATAQVPTAGAAQQPASVASAAPVAQSAPAATVQRVDIEQVLNGLAAKNPQKLNWRTSIVDLMKLVGLESSLQERKELADELGYKGDKSDSAAMNIWLHQQVMRKLEENGGQVPADLKH